MRLTSFQCGSPHSNVAHLIPMWPHLIPMRLTSFQCGSPHSNATHLIPMWLTSFQCGSPHSNVASPHSNATHLIPMWLTSFQCDSPHSNVAHLIPMWLTSFQCGFTSFQCSSHQPNMMVSALQCRQSHSNCLDYFWHCLRTIRNDLFLLCHLQTRCTVLHTQNKLLRCARVRPAEFMTLFFL